MSTPITWRNVTGPSAADASRPMEVASNTINGAFDIFGRLIDQRQTIDANNVKQLDENAKQAYLGRLAQAKTPEELVALQQSGELGTMMSGLSSQSQAAVRGADEARLTSVRQGLVAQQAYNAQQQALKDAPTVDAVMSDLAKGDNLGALMRTAGSDVALKAPLYQAIKTSDRNQVVEKRGDTSYAQQQESYLHGLQMRPLADAALVRGNTKGELDLTETQRKLAEDETNRSTDNFVATLASKHQSNSAEYRRAVGEVADAYGSPIPRNPDGSINKELLSPVDLTAFNKHLLSKGLPTLNELQAGDTAAIADAKTKIRAAGMTPVNQARAEAQLGTLFNTSPTPLAGNDAEAAAKAERISAQLSASSAMQNGVAATPQNIKDLTAAAIEAINQITQPGSWKRENFTEAAMEFLNSGGIEQDGIRVLPGPDKFKQMILGTKQSWSTLFDSTEIGNQFKGWKGSSEATAGAKEVARKALEAQIKALR